MSIIEQVNDLGNVIIIKQNIPDNKIIVSNIAPIRVGPTGPTGIQGPSGPIGVTGPQGPIGQTGPSGVNGVVGGDGATGPTGMTGPIGETGPQGIQGIPGIQGPSGSIGLTGATGMGETGPQGIQGPSGSVGATGPIGPTGLTGATGPEGPIGPSGSDTGFTGPQGIQGPSGSIGATGLQGPSGSIGATGPQGIQGDIGVTGPQGIQGPSGSVGATGPIGQTGPQGIQGDVGSTGPIGVTGPQGPSGSVGATGLTGPTGVAGTTTYTGLTDIPVGIVSSSTQTVTWTPNSASYATSASWAPGGMGVSASYAVSSSWAPGAISLFNSTIGSYHIVTTESYATGSGSNAIPNMSGTTIPYGTAIGTNKWTPNSEYWHGLCTGSDGKLDGRDGGFVASPMASTLGYQFTGSIVIKSYGVVPSRYDVNAFEPKTWTFEGSNNGSSWTTLDTRTNWTTWTLYTASIFSTNNTSSYTYYRMNTTANYGGTTTYLRIGALQMFTNTSGSFIVTSSVSQSIMGTGTIAQIDTTKGNSAFIDYVMLNPTSSSTNLRAGNLSIVWDNTGAFTYSTGSLTTTKGTTSYLTFNPVLSASIIQLNVSNSLAETWSAKTDTKII